MTELLRNKRRGSTIEDGGSRIALKLLIFAILYHLSSILDLREALAQVPARSVPMTCLRDDALTTLTPAEGQQVPCRVDSVGNIWVGLGTKLDDTNDKIAVRGKETSGTLQSAATANGNGTTLATTGLVTATLTVNCSSCSGGSAVNFEGTEDGTNYSAIYGYQLGTNTIASTTTISGLTYWRLPVGGLQNIRARISGYGAGTITVTGRAIGVPTTARVSNAMLAPNTGLPALVPTILQTVGNVTASGTTVTATFTPTAGNSLIALCGINNTGTISVSDNNSNTYTTAKSQTGTVAGALVSFAVNANAGATTVTCTAGTTGVVTVTVHEVAGLLAQIPAQPDATDSNTGSAQTSATLSAAGLNPLTSVNEIAFGALVLTTNNAVTAANSWSIDTQQGATGGRLAPFRQVLPSLTNIAGSNGVGTFSSASYALAVATFRSVSLNVAGEVKLLDGAGNKRAANVDSTNRLSVSVDNSNVSTNVAQFGGTNISTGTGAGGSGIPRVTISNDSSLAANQSVNVAQMNGVATTMGNGVSGTGVQRVTIASDSTGQVALATGSNTIGALTANQSVNAAQINGVTPLMGNGATGTGSLRITPADNSSAIANWGHGATGSASPSGATQVGMRATGNLTTPIICDNVARYNAATSGSTELVALTSSQTIYICGWKAQTNSATGVDVKLVYGTGTNCGTGSNDITMTWNLDTDLATGFVDNGDYGNARKTAASNALCINSSGAVTVRAEVLYTKF